MKNSKELYLARAVPIRPAVLAAALSSYIETKAALTTFFLCAKYAHNSANALAGLPLEILYRIASFHRDVANAEALEEWTDGFECLTDECIPSDHLTTDELEKLEAKAREDFGSSGDAESDRFGDFLFERIFDCDIWHEDHWNQMEAYREEIEDETSKLSSDRNIFEGDSGIKLYFNWLPESYPEPIGGRLGAFMMLPLQEFAIKENIGPHVASISILGGIKPSALLSVSEAQLSLFDQALRKLNLPSLAKLKASHDYKTYPSENKASYPAAPGEQGVVAETRPLVAQAEEDDNNQWPVLMLLGGARHDVGRDT